MVGTRHCKLARMMWVIGVLLVMVAFGEETDEPPTDKTPPTEEELQAKDVSSLKLLSSLEVPKNVDATMATLIRQLGDKSFKVRRKAQKRLEALSVLAENWVLDATSHDDPEIATRSCTILERIAGSDAALDISAAIEHLQERKHPKLFASVCRILPCCAGDLLFTNACEALKKAPAEGREAALWGLAKTGGCTVTVGIAVTVLADLADEKDLAKLHPFLKHASERVRMDSAIALANRSDRKALLALGDLLASTNGRTVDLCRSVLRQLTGHEAFVSAPNSTVAKAWTTWLSTHGATVKLKTPAIRNAWPGIAGSTWVLTSTINGKIHTSEITFDRNGTFVYHQSPELTNGWSIQNGKLIFHINNHFSTFTCSKRSSGTLTGTATNQNGLSWTWEAKVAP